MAKIGRVMGHREEFEVDLGGPEKLRCTFIRSEIPFEYYERSDEFKRAEYSEVSTLEHWIATILAAQMEWDLEEDDGTRIPLNAASLKRFASAIPPIFVALDEAMAPKARSAETTGSR